MNVLTTLLQFCKDHVQSKSDPCTAEGGTDGELLPGSSLVFAAMEVCLCLLAKYYPALDPSSSSARNYTQMKAAKVDQDLVASSLDVMALVPSICSPQGSLAVLPTLLHLVTIVLKEGQDIESASVQAALRCLREFSCHPYSKLGDTQAAYGRLLQSCAARLLDWAKGVQNERLHPIILLSAVTEMMLHARPGLLSCPALLYPSLNAFQQCLQASDVMLKLHAIRMFSRLLHDAGKQSAAGARVVLAPYVHAMAPKIVAYLCSPACRQLESQQQLLVTTEALGSVEALATLADSEHCNYYCISVIVY